MVCSGKKGLSTLEIVILMIVMLVGAGVFLYFIVTGMSGSEKSSGCKGIFSGYTQEELDCYPGDSCPKGTEPVSGSGWAALSGGCGRGRVCCAMVSESAEPITTGGAGFVEVRAGTDKAEGGRILTKGMTYETGKGDTEFFMKSTGDIVTCSATMYYKKSDGTYQEDKIKDKDTKCAEGAGFSYDFKEEKKHELQVTGYNANGDAVDVKKFYFNVGDYFGGGELKSSEFTFIIDYQKDGLFGKQELENEGEYIVDLDSVSSFELKCDGCKLSITAPESEEATEKGPGIYPEFKFEKDGTYIFKIVNKEGKKIAEYWLTTRNPAAAGIKVNIIYQENGKSTSIEAENWGDYTIDDDSIQIVVDCDGCTIIATDIYGIEEKLGGKGTYDYDLLYKDDYLPYIFDVLDASGSFLLDFMVWHPETI